jgi:hypothetical protein
MKRLLLFFFVIAMFGAAFAQENATIRCRIWQSVDYCHLPDSVVLFKSLHCDKCTWSYYPCADVFANGSEQVVWLTMTGNWISLTMGNKWWFQLENHFKNVCVIKKSNGKQIYPYGIMLEGNPDFLKAKFRCKNYTVNYDPEKRFDLFVLFYGIEKGDTFKIDGFVEAKIK